MSDVLTKEGVLTIKERYRYGQSFAAHVYIVRLCDSHEALRAQLTEAQGEIARVTAERDELRERDRTLSRQLERKASATDPIGLAWQQAIARAETAEAQLDTARADLATAEQEKARLRADRDRLARTLANDPDGAAKKLVNLAKLYTVCDRCEQETTEQNESNIMCDACLAKSEQAREALQTRIEKLKSGLFIRHWSTCDKATMGSSWNPRCTCGLDSLLTDALLAWALADSP